LLRLSPTVRPLSLRTLLGPCALILLRLPLVLLGLLGLPRRLRPRDRLRLLVGVRLRRRLPEGLRGLLDRLRDAAPASAEASTTHATTPGRTS
jgi:hypothetical protein